MRLQIIRLQHLVDVLEQIVLQELLGRQVHVERERGGGRGAAAFLEQLPGLIEQPAPDGDDEPRLLGEGNEVLGRDEPALGMRPADERLEPLDAPGRHLDDGQVVHAELLAHQRPPQVGLQVEQLRRALAHGGVEQHGPRATLRLGPVHGRVRVEHQVLGPRVSRRRERGTDARGGEHLVARDGERLGGDLVDAVGDHRGVVRLAHVVEQDGELVASLARQRIALAQAGVQARGHLDEKLVARGMAQTVVHRLEAVQVEEEHREAVPLAPAGPREGALHQVEEQRPVGQPCERIVEGVVQHAVGDRLALRDVHQRAGEADRLAAAVL